MSTESAKMGWNSGYSIKTKEESRELTSKTVKIGREIPGKQPDASHILIPGDSVSRHHATLKWQFLKGCYLLVHESATNPTLVNDEPAKRILLAPGDKIRIGNTTLLISKTDDTTPKASIVSETLQELHKLIPTQPQSIEEAPVEIAEAERPEKTKSDFKWVPPEDRS